MESFEASGAAKRHLTCHAMPADGVEVKKERSAEQQQAQRRRYRLAKQSGVPNINWSTGALKWQVNFPKRDSRGKFVSLTSRGFAVKKFMVQGRSEAEADAAALEAAKAFHAELVEKGILGEPKLKDPEFTSEVTGVSWSKSYRKWLVQRTLNKGKRIHGGYFTEKAAAEAKALELQEKHGLQLQLKPVPTLANRYAGLPVFQPKVPYPGVWWTVREQKWHAQCLVGGARRNFMVKPKDHSEAELERSFTVAVAWKKKQEKEKKRKALQILASSHGSPDHSPLAGFTEDNLRLPMFSLG